MNNRDLSLAVVIPVYNEAPTLRELFRRVAQVPAVSEIIMVDDFSTDGSREILKEIEGEHKTKFPPPKYRLKVVYSNRNMGKGASIRKGLKEVNSDLTIVQDADLEYDPNEYMKLVQPIADGSADVVYGSRFLGFPRRVHLFWHTVGNKLLTLISNMTTNLNLTDMETCYKMFKSDIIKSIPIRSDRFGFEPEITAKVAKLGCRIYEVPISYKGRTYAEGKKIRLKDGVQALFAILKYWLIDDIASYDIEHFTLRIIQRAIKYNKWLYSRFEQYVGDNILEIGAGIGNITRFLLSHKNVMATDVSLKLLNELTLSYGGYQNLNVAIFDIENTTNKGNGYVIANTYDTIVCLNVLEHIKDDIAALKNMYNLLQKGGRIILFVPANMRLYSDIDKNLGHHRRYGLTELMRKLKEAGFRVISARYYNIIGAWGWFVNGKLLGRKHISPTQTRLFNKILMPALQLEDYIETSFGMSILAVAEK